MVSKLEILSQVRQALKEDRVDWDVTSQAVLAGARRELKAAVRTREAGVFSGEAIVAAFNELLGRDLQAKCLVKDGDRLESGQTLLTLEGGAGTCLAAERSLLNFLSLSCGVASLTRRCVDLVGNARTRILATRKTLPGLRWLQLMAVVHGGGHIHRRDLADGILIKDNHLLLASIHDAVDRAKRVRSPLHRVEVEVDTLDQLREAMAAEPDVIMLDNFSMEDLKAALQLLDGRVPVEVSGGVEPEGIPALAELGVDYISLGRLTHSVKALDLTLEIKTDA